MELDSLSDVRDMLPGQYLCRAVARITCVGGDEFLCISEYVTDDRKWHNPTAVAKTIVVILVC